MLKDFTWKAKALWGRALLEGMLPINQRWLGEGVEEDMGWLS